MSSIFAQVIGGVLLSGIVGYISLRAKAWRIRSVLKGDPDFKVNAKIASLWDDGFIILKDVAVTKVKMTWHGWGSRVFIVGTCWETGYRIRRDLPLLRFMKFDRFYVHNDRRTKKPKGEKQCSD